MAKSVLKNSLMWFVCPVNLHVEAIGLQISMKQSTGQGQGRCLGKTCCYGHCESITTRTVVVPQQDLDLLSFVRRISRGPYVVQRLCHVKILVECASFQLLKFSIVDLQCENKEEHHL